MQITRSNNSQLLTEAATEETDIDVDVTEDASRDNTNCSEGHRQ